MRQPAIVLQGVRSREAAVRLLDELWRRVDATGDAVPADLHVEIWEENGMAGPGVEGPPAVVGYALGVMSSLSAQVLYDVVKALLRTRRTRGIVPWVDFDMARCIAEDDVHARFGVVGSLRIKGKACPHTKRPSARRRGYRFVLVDESGRQYEYVLDTTGDIATARMLPTMAGSAGGWKREKPP
jgi:hypothetical protein